MQQHRSCRISQLLLTLTLGAGSAAAQTFTIIGLPDTQNYSENFPAIFADQTQWVADHIDSLFIRYVSHYGDVVQNGNVTAEWVNADAAMVTLDQTAIPYGVTPGNHDITPSGISGTPYIPSFYQNWFGPQRFTGRSWFRGASPSGMSSYQVFDAHGLQFLALHVECDAALRELEWAQGVLHENRDKPVVFTTHRYLQDAEDYTAGVPIVPSGRYPEIWYAIEGVYPPDGIRSQQLFDWFVRRNPNILLVNCGHFHEEYRQTSTNAAGHPVHEVLADYQDDPNGGNGWLRIMTFDLGQNRIDVDSYSPWLDAWRTTDESQFSLPVVFDDYYQAEPTVVLQQGIADYQGTVDTWINQDAQGQSNGSDDRLAVDDDITNSPFSDRRAQALIRFDGLIGDPGVGRVPPGAVIERAWLTLEVLEDIDAPSEPDFFLHQVLVPWSANSTWSSLTNGLQVGSELLPNPIVIAGDNDRNGDGLRRIDVTTIVQNWADGDANHGFAIVPEVISLKDDGIEIASSEFGNALLRPKLEVTWQSDCGMTRFGLGSSPVNALVLHGLGLPRVGGTIEVTAANGTDGLVLTAASFASANAPLFGGELLIDPSQLIATWFGPTALVLPVVDDPAFAGTELFFQCLQPDPGQPQGFVLSNGVRAKLCQ